MALEHFKAAILFLCKVRTGLIASIYLHLIYLKNNCLWNTFVAIAHEGSVLLLIYIYIQQNS